MFDYGFIWVVIRIRVYDCIGIHMHYYYYLVSNAWSNQFDVLWTCLSCILFFLFLLYINVGVSPCELGVIITQ